MRRYADQFNTFYLYEGQLVILQVMGSYDIPLPEICEYLRGIHGIKMILLVM